MYFWRTDQLIEDLKHNSVSQAQFKNYYLASGLIILLSFCVVSQTSSEEMKLSLAILVINIGLLISWTNAAFKANGGENGRDFLNRFIALYLPITIKTSVFFILAIFCFEIILTPFEGRFDEAQLAYIEALETAVVDISVSFVVYWRIYVAMGKVNT